jgi:hypothetical protein
VPPLPPDDPPAVPPVPPSEDVLLWLLSLLQAATVAPSAIRRREV